MKINESFHAATFFCLAGEKEAAIEVLMKSASLLNIKTLSNPMYNLLTAQMVDLTFEFTNSRITHQQLNRDQALKLFLLEYLQEIS